MQPRSTNHEGVTDLTTYRQRKTDTEAVELPQLNAEDTIVEIAKYVMMIVDAITRSRH